jgi:DNA-binding response OmpR family regulator
VSETSTNKRVLIAYCERVIADTLAMILNQSGFEALAVYSGEKAVEAAQGFRPDCFLTEVTLTRMNGVDAAIEIRSGLPGMKIILSAGHVVAPELLDKVRAHGYEFELMAVPIHPQDLLNKLRGYFRRL